MLEHTSVPRWDAFPPPVPPAARQVAVLGLGAATDPTTDEVVAAWVAAARTTGAEVTTLRATDYAAARTWLEAETQRALVGWRLLVAGPEADVLRARARALELGAIAAEVLPFVTGVPTRRVHCAHCGTETETTVPVDGTCPCAGCGRTLHVHHHVSRRWGTYLGYMVDAEDAEPAGTAA
ncbi:dimethylamine monooxygenase subunit DmmA family protein [Modestobacter sp. SYSU DS0657]